MKRNYVISEIGTKMVIEINFSMYLFPHKFVFYNTLTFYGKSHLIYIILSRNKWTRGSNVEAKAL